MSQTLNTSIASIISQNNITFTNIAFSGSCSGGAGTRRLEDGSYLIFISQYLPSALQTFLLLHEIAHIVLGHLGATGKHYLEEEVAADRWAMEHGGELAAFTAYMEALLGTGFFEAGLWKNRQTRRLDILHGRQPMITPTHRCIYCHEVFTEDEFEDKGWETECPHCWNTDSITTI